MKLTCAFAAAVSSRRWRRRRGRGFMRLTVVVVVSVLAIPGYWLNPEDG
jgi:hypothetical protein